MREKIKKLIREYQLYLYPLRFNVLYDILAIIRTKGISKIVDYGIGNALYKSKLQKHGIKKYTGIDIYKNPHVDYLVGDLDRVNSKFELALCLDVLQHCEEPSEILSKISTLLVRDGLLYITIPMLYPICDFKDYWRWTPEGFEMLCRKSNFSIVYRKQRGSFFLFIISTIIFLVQKYINGNFVSWNKLTEPYGRLKIALSFLLTLPFYPIAWVCYICDVFVPNKCISVGYRYLLIYDRFVD